MKEERISKTKAVLMIVIALGFDLAQFATGIILLMASVVGFFASWIPFFGGLAAAALMFLATATQSVLSWAIIGMGYLTLILWFLLSGVSLMKGEYVLRKVMTSFVALLVDFMPFLNVLPGITIWTIVQIYIVRREDAEEKKKREESMPTNTMRLRRRIIRSD